MKNNSSSDCRIANSTHNFTSKTFLVNPNSSRLMRCSLKKICRFCSLFSRQFFCMEEWVNFEFGSSLFGDLFGENSSSGGVNTQVLYTYMLKAHPNSSSFVTYVPPKSSSENRQNVASNQASSGQSSGSGKRSRRCIA